MGTSPRSVELYSFYPGFHTLSKAHIGKSLNIRNFGTRRPGTHPAHAYASINPLLDVRTTSVTHIHGILQRLVFTPIHGMARARAGRAPARPGLAGGR